MAGQKLCSILFLLLSLWGHAEYMAAVIRVGVVLDLNSTLGEMAESCIFMALSDFYAANANYRTRLTLSTRNSRGDVLGAACSGNINVTHMLKIVLSFSLEKHQYIHTGKNTYTSARMLIQQ
jgi:hypothetical protein